MHYQSTEETNGGISAGGLTISQDRSELYFSAIQGTGVDSVCHVYQVGVGVGASLDGSSSGVTPLVEPVPAMQGISCYYLERHHSNLFIGGYNFKEGWGSMSLFDLRKENSRPNEIDFYELEQPIAIASSMKEKAIFAVSQQRWDVHEEDEANDIGSSDEVPLPDEARKFFPYLSFPSASAGDLNNPPFALVVIRFDQYMVAEWSQPYFASSSSRVNDSLQAHVFASGIVAYDDFLLVVGSTVGYGNAFGSGSGNDRDGFLTKLNIADGTLVPSGNIRFGSSMDDWILNVCYQPNTSSSDNDDTGGEDEMRPGDNFIYIVGTTQGSVTGSSSANVDNPSHQWRGFVAKMNIQTLRQEWAIEFPADHDNWVTHCKVQEEDSSVVFVTGVVEGGSLQQQQQQQSDDGSGSSEYYHGQSDVFVARINDGGQLAWVQQLGSDRNDRPTGLELLSLSGNDQLLLLFIYGETFGSVFAENPNEYSQIVLWTLDGNTGNIPNDDSQLDQQQQQQQEPPTLSPVTPAPSESPTPAPVEPPTPTPVEPPTPTPVEPPTPTPVEPAAPESSGNDMMILPEDIDEELEATPPPDEEWTEGGHVKDDDKAKARESLVSKIAENSSGFQSDMGATYASSMVYDFDRHSVYLTGSSYGHAGHEHRDNRHTAHCFLIHLRMVQYRSTHLKNTEEEADEDLVQSCNAIDQQGNDLYLAGMQVHDPKKSLYSILSHLQRTREQPDWTPTSNNWLQEDTTPIGYPVSVLADDRNIREGDSVFIMTLQSSETKLNEEYAIHYNPSAPNLTPSGYVKYGENFQVTVQHYHSSNDPSQNKMAQHWQRIFETGDDDSEDRYFTASGLAQLGDQLFAVGSVKGNWNDVSQSSGDSGMDGFVIALDAADGTNRAESPSQIFDSMDQGDEWIHNICASSSSSESDYVYIVGQTNGDLGSGTRPSGSLLVDAFVAKLEASTLKTVWVHQFHTSRPTSSSAESNVATNQPSAVAYGCALVPREGILYVAGVVYNGGTIDLPVEKGQTKSYGEDDVFVSRLDSSTGEVLWLRQIGTFGTENLARNRGIIADMDGNAVIFGDTTGELFRARSSLGLAHERNSPDIFVATLDKTNGSYAPTVETIKLELWAVVLVGLLSLCLFVGGCSYCRRRRQRKLEGGSKYFPRYDSEGFHDEEEELVGRTATRGQVELVESSSLGVGRGGINAFAKQLGGKNSTRSLDDFMPEYYSSNANASRPGRNVV